MSLQDCMQFKDVKDMFKELGRKVGKLQINDEVRHEVRQLYEKGGGTCSEFAGVVSRDA